MKFFVSTVLEQQDDFEVTGDVFYINERKVKVAGVEQLLHYGDIVQHGDFSYYVNEDNIKTTGFDNSFDAFWQLKNGEIPADGKRYFLIVNEDVNYASDLYAYKSLHHNIISRDDEQIHIHAIEGDKFFSEKTNKAYTVGELISEYKETAHQFQAAVKLFNESKVEEPSAVEEVVRTEVVHLQAEPTGFAGMTKQELIEIVTDGLVRHGKDGTPGLPGSDGRDGRDGKDGRSGERGEKGDIGEKGQDGPMGPSGEKGAQGQRGEKGERGEIGPAGPQGPQGPAGKDANPIFSKEEWEKFQKTNEEYKRKLNTQLASLGGGGSDVLMENRDVVYAAPAALSNGQFLAYDNTQGKFALTDIDTLVGGTGGSNTWPVYIQNATPTTTADKYLWIQTGLGSSSNSWTFWFEDGT